MLSDDLEKLHYPIGKFNTPNIISPKQLHKWIAILEKFPQQLNKLTKNLSDKQLDTP